MTTNVIMPVLGMVQDTGRIISWRKHIGENVRQGEILLEIETDKAIQELEAPASGILAQILANEGDEVPVTQVMAVILTPEEYRSRPPVGQLGVVQIAAPGASSRDKGVSIAPTASPAELHVEGKNHPEPIPSNPQGVVVTKEGVVTTLTKLAVDISAERPSGRILASPKARRLAQEFHLDLASLNGSGPGGAILARDVELRSVEVRELYITPQISFHRTVRVAQFISWLNLLQKNSLPIITLTDLMVLVVSRALVKHPKINSIWQDGQIIPHDEINICVALEAENSWMMPVIHQADRLTLIEIANARQNLENLAQTGKLQIEDTSGGTFTIYNLGTYGVDSVDIRLESPQAAILAMGRITDQVIPVNGAQVIQPVMDLNFSFDPRAINGAHGAMFLETLAATIAEPLLLLG